MHSSRTQELCTERFDDGDSDWLFALAPKNYEQLVDSLQGQEVCTERVEDDSSNLLLALASEAYEESVVGSLHQDFVGVSQVRVDDDYEHFIEKCIKDLEKYKDMDESEFYLDKLLEGISLPEPVEMQSMQKKKQICSPCMQPRNLRKGSEGCTMCDKKVDNMATTKVWWDWSA